MPVQAEPQLDPRWSALLKLGRPRRRESPGVRPCRYDRPVPDSTTHAPPSPEPRKEESPELCTPVPAILVTDTPNAEDVALISDALDEFNVQEAGTYDRRLLAVLVKDPETKRVVGGLIGHTSLGLPFVDLFHLPPALRGPASVARSCGRGKTRVADADVEQPSCTRSAFRHPVSTSGMAGEDSGRSPVIHLERAVCS